MEKDTQLVKACRDGNLAQVKKLLDEGADINYRNGDPLEWAIVSGHTVIVKYLLERGATLSEGPMGWIKSAEREPEECVNSIKSVPIVRNFLRRRKLEAL